MPIESSMLLNLSIFMIAKSFGWNIFKLARLVADVLKHFSKFYCNWLDTIARASHGKILCREKIALHQPDRQSGRGEVLSQQYNHMESTKFYWCDFKILYKLLLYSSLGFWPQIDRFMHLSWKDNGSIQRSRGRSVGAPRFRPSVDSFVLPSFPARSLLRIKRLTVSSPRTSRDLSVRRLIGAGRGEAVRQR